MERVPRRIFRMLETTKVLIALVLLGTIDGERNVSEKQSDMKTLIEKMRTNTDKQNRKTEALPLRRFRKKMQRARQTDGSPGAKALAAGDAAPSSEPAP